ncbi:MAG: NAD(P)H-binding protein [Bacteroidota bacterium]
MKTLLLGATGRTGNLVLEAALGKGYEVSCLVRDAKTIQPQKGVAVHEGNPMNKADLERAIKGCDAIINVLNVSRKSDFPWSPLRSPKNLISATIAQVVEIAERTKIKRIVTCSAWGARETKKDIPLWFRTLIERSNIGVAYADHERQEDLLEKSSMDWTIVRPVGLTNSKNHQKVLESFYNVPKPNLTISRNTLAKYLVNCIEKEDLIHKKVVVSAK